MRKRWPQFFFEGRAAFNFEADKDDSVVNDVIEFLRIHGREPYFKRYPSRVNLETGHDKFYQVQGKRVFDPEDYRRAEFFHFFPAQSIGSDAVRSDGGYIRLAQLSITGAKIGSVMISRLAICRDLLKKLMKAEGFAGLAFQHVEVSECRKPAEPLWKLESDRQMPPVLNRLVNHMGETFDPAVHRDCWPDDDYEPFLLRFPEAAMRAMGDFDAALTHERYGIPLDPILIVSRRFRDWCERRKLKLDWYPVALE